jgi:uncharacterized protein (TIGR03790 family)
MVNKALRESYFCMAKIILLNSSCIRTLRGVSARLLLCVVVSTTACAQPGAALPGAAVPPARQASQPAVPLRWLSVPRVFGHVTARELGLVINLADPYSVEVGEYYRRMRQIPPENIMRVTLPHKPQIDAAELELLREQVTRHFDARVQALALAWVEPWAASCQSITTALTLGLDPDLCSHTCAPARMSPLFNSASGAPFRDHGLRPSMLVAAADATQARALIDRGLASDHTLGLLGSPPVHAWFMSTRDGARNVRAALFPPPGVVGRPPLQVHVEKADELRDKRAIVLMQTGLPTLNPGALDSLEFVPGALADHLTSFGGRLTDPLGQTSALAWISAGATASYGTVSEPCNHLQKFPHPQLLLLHYAQGSSAIEAYWKSVAWPAQGLFIGDPLAAPFAR